MALKTQHVPSQLRVDKDDIFISLQEGDNASLEDLEFRERHGEQYHLRHHLSGCAQTLYTIDFDSDFTAPSATPTQSTLSMTSQADTVLGLVTTSMTHSDPAMMGVPDVQHTILNTSLTADASQSTGYVVFTPQENDAAEIHLTEAIDEAPLGIQPASSAHAGDEISPPAGATTQVNSPLIADFNDGTLGGWSLQDDLSADAVLENGKLHFSAENLHHDTALLSQSLSLVADQHYQFQMSLQTDAGAEPPQFVLNINGENYAMNAVRDGNNLVLQVEFVAYDTDIVTLSIVPVGVTPVVQNLWLDDLILMPVVPSVSRAELSAEMSVIQDESVFDFARLATEPASDLAGTAISHLNLPMLLQDIHPSLFIDADAMQAVHSDASVIDVMLEFAHSAEWTDIADMPQVYTGSIQNESLEMSTVFV